MDFNSLYYDHQLSLIRAREASTDAVRQGYETEAARIAGRIGQRQAGLGAAGAGEWLARACEQSA